MFKLTAEEARALRSQFATLKTGRGQHRKFLPYAFTEQGVAMLNSDRAIEVNIAIMPAFVRLREIMSTHKDLARKLDDLERKLGEHDEKFAIVFEAIRQLMIPPAEPAKTRIGFHQGDSGDSSLSDFGFFIGGPSPIELGTAGAMIIVVSRPAEMSSAGNMRPQRPAVSDFDIPISDLGLHWGPWATHGNGVRADGIDRKMDERKIEEKKTASIP